MIFLRVLADIPVAACTAGWSNGKKAFGYVGATPAGRGCDPPTNGSAGKWPSATCRAAGLCGAFLSIATQLKGCFNV